MKFKSILKIALTALLWPILSTSSVAQFKDPSTMLSPSPNATSLGLYGEVPVSYFTGIPSISIPLYQLQGKSIGINLNLSYHASGVRPNIHPGWVGNGWSLNVGGVITRVKNGLCDETKTTNSMTTCEGFYFNYEQLLSTDWYIDRRIKSWNYYETIRDVEPDVFEFNFQGYSGKFFLNQYGQWQVQCEQPIKVIFNNTFDYSFLGTIPEYSNPNKNAITKYFQEFTLVDEMGNKYTFGENEAIEYSDDIIQNDQKNGFHATSWFLTKIESANCDETINFTYERGPYISSLYRVINSFDIATGGTEFLPPCPGSSVSIGTTGKVTSPIYLKTIEIPQQNIKVEFSVSKSNELTYTKDNYRELPFRGGDDKIKIVNQVDIPYYINNGITGNAADLEEGIKRFIWFKLDRIKVINTVGKKIVRELNFVYNEDPRKRLELKSIATVGENVGIYQMAYNTAPLPNYLEVITDHWGYNNNISQPQGVNNINVGQLRSVNENALRAGVLERITYPTGGYSEFTFEANRYDNVLANDRKTVIPSGSHLELAGGLRIQKIKTFDNNRNELTKEYFYVTNYSPGANIATLPSSGLLEAAPKYYFSNNTAVDSDGITFTYSIFSSNPVVPLTHSSTGCHIGYNEVVEKLSDNSYTIFKFTNHHTGNLDDTPINTFNQGNTPNVIYSSREVERGKLLMKSTYHASGLKNTEELIEYKAFGFVASPSIFNENFIVCKDAQMATRSTVTRTAYYNYSYKYLPVKVKNTTWNNQGQLPIVQTTEMDYNKYGNITYKNVSGSSGSEQIKRFVSSGDLDCTFLYTKIEDERQQCIKMAETIYNSCRLFCLKQTGGQTTIGTECNEICQTEYNNAQDECLSSFLESKKELETKINEYVGIFKTMQDRNMLSFPVEELSVTKRDGKEYLTGGVMTKYKDIGAGVIMPRESYRLNLSQPLATFSPAHVGDDGSFISQPEYTKEASYTFSPKATLTQQEQVGQPIASYLWDAAGEHPIAKAINAPSGTWLHENFEEGGFNTERQELIVAKTGIGSTKACVMDWGNNKTITLEAGRTYKLSFWAKRGTTAENARVVVATGGQGIADLILITPANGDWIFGQQEFKIPAGQSGVCTVSILSGGWGGGYNLTQYSYIDDVRIAPADAQVTSYTWEPGVGMTSQTDPLGLTTTYEYDGLGRLIRVRDSEGKVVQEHRYKYATEQ